MRAIHSRRLGRDFARFVLLGLLLLVAQVVAQGQYSFSGDMKRMVSGITSDRTGMIISIAASDYDAQTDEGTALSTLGPISLGNNGVVLGKKTKSGWVNFGHSGDYTGLVPKKTVTVELSGVSFWVNDGGRNWLTFEVGSATLDGDNVDVKTGIEHLPSGGTRPWVLLAGKYRLSVSILDLTHLHLTPLPNHASHASASGPTPTVRNPKPQQQ
jgi:hypothetical protein